MIPNPGAYLKRYIADHYPDINVAHAKIVEIGSSAHVDVPLPLRTFAVSVRLMLPHTAPAKATPLLAEVYLQKRLIWDYRDEMQYWGGNRVHLYEVAGTYFMLYVKPDRSHEWLLHINALDDLFRERPRLSAQAELAARVLTAQKLGYRIELNRQQQGQVRHMLKRYA
ncbi:MAG TPA: hypothetical protein VKP88_06930 [Candidatus Paceibacterota bacterium]|nr:hypothetical protein [Candidatus Paceibacterota bacterium]